MKRNFWKWIWVLVAAIFLVGKLIQIGYKPNNEEQKRLELLKTNEWLSIEFQVMLGENVKAICNYGPNRYNGAKEYVHIGIFTQGESSQFYSIYGTGDKISEVCWQLGLNGSDVKISVPNMKSNALLPVQIKDTVD